jgi:hypothetical protein
MKIRALPFSLVLVVPVVLFVLLGAAGALEEMKSAGKEDTEVIGPTSRDQIEAAVPDWVTAEVEARPERDTARALAAVKPGAEVTVFLGTWCGDSRREVTRFWKALAEAGGDVPFAVRYVGVDRSKREPAEALAENDVRYLPTFIVRRAGSETGRIVETSPHGVERDLLDLLTGKEKGILTTRTDMAATAGPAG